MEFITAGQSNVSMLF